MASTDRNSSSTQGAGLKKMVIGIVTVVVAVVVACVILVILNLKPSGANSDRAVVEKYFANAEKEYSNDEKVEIVTAYKNLLENEGEDYVDDFLTRDQQNELTFMGMGVNVYVFRDYKNYGYLNSDDSFINVEGYKTIAGFDVDAAIGADGFANLEAVEIKIDGEVWAVADLRDEIADFMTRFDAANEVEKTTTIYGVDKVDVDENTRLYITYLDVQYDDSKNVTALRVSGHLLMK